MIVAKNTQRAKVTMLSNGCFRKRFLHTKAAERFANEVKILLHLEMAECGFVPRLVDYDAKTLTIVTDNCGQSVQFLSPDRVAALFEELLEFGVQHDDPELRNITYDVRRGRFCAIDFEFATLLPDWRPTTSLPNLESQLTALEGLLIGLN